MMGTERAKNTYSKCDNSRGENKEAVLSHTLRETNESASNPKHDPPQENTNEHTSCSHKPFTHTKCIITYKES